MKTRTRHHLSAVTALLAAGIATGGDTESWVFDLSTEGEDVFWTSPTAVDIEAPRYDTTYEITLLEITVRWLVFEFTLDQTESIPPEMRSGSAILEGPLPIVLFSDRVAFPPPPEDPGIEATLDIRIDTEGFGQFAMTDVILSEVEVEIPGFGLQTVQIEGIRLAGRIDISTLGPASDINGDGVIDVADLLLVLASWGDCPEPPEECPADVNGDGVVDVADLLRVLAEWS